MDTEGVRLGPVAERKLRHWVALVVSALAVLAGARASAGTSAGAARASFTYLYMEPNTGGSSGGHTALCLRKSCYHFQQSDDGIIRLRRELQEQVDFAYRVLDNRSIDASRVAVSHETEARLQAAFEHRLLVQDRHLDTLDELGRDRLLLGRLRARDTGRPPEGEPAPPRLPGSGYFADPGGTASALQPLQARQSAALAGVRRRLLAAHGADFFDRRAAELRATIARLVPAEDRASPYPVGGVLPPRYVGFATRYEELLGNLAAVDVLSAASTLNTEATWRKDAPELRLSSDELEVLQAYRDRLEGRLVRLVSSTRPDWGFPLLIGLARLAAIDESLASGSLVVLDVFAEDAPVVPGQTVAAHADTLRLVAEDRRLDFQRLRRGFFDVEVPDEARFSMLELATNLWLETVRAVETEAVMRVPPDRPLPQRSVRRSDWPMPAISGEALDDASRRARSREVAYRAAVGRIYPYDLVGRNCVTELFRTVEISLLGEDVATADHRTVRSASERELGGYVDWRRGLEFVPAVSMRAVNDTYRLVATEHRPSRRRLALADMYATESAVRVDLRESNVLTARSYERNRNDALFLFFTDEVFLRRPLYGAANVAVGIGGTIAGLVLAPFDRGRTLRAGLMGTVFSLPELAMINVRKGSFVFAPRHWGQ